MDTDTWNTLEGAEGAMLSTDEVDELDERELDIWLPVELDDLTLAALEDKLELVLDDELLMIFGAGVEGVLATTVFSSDQLPTASPALTA